jgi:hypothetical protein
VERRFGNERGSAVVVSLLMVAVLLLLGSAFLSVSLTETMIAANQIAGVRAFHLAEAGLDHARVVLEDADIDELLGDDGVLLGNEALGFGNYTVTVSNNNGNPFPLGSVPDDSGGDENDTDGFIVLTSYGTYRNAERAVQAVVHADSGPWGKWGVLSHTHVSIQGSSVVEGAVHANGNVILGGNASVIGDVTAYGLISEPYDGQITGTSTTPAPKQKADLLDCPAAFGPPPEGPGVNYDPVRGDVTITGSEDTVFTSGTYFFDDLIKSGTGRMLVAPGEVVEIFVTGAVNITGNGFTGNSGAADLRIIGCGENPAMLDAAPTWEFNATSPSSLVIYAPAHNVKVLGGGTVSGVVIGKSIFKNGTGHLRVDTSVSQAGGGNFSVIPGTWRELR